MDQSYTVLGERAHKPGGDADKQKTSAVGDGNKSSRGNDGDDNNDLATDISGNEWKVAKGKKTHKPTQDDEGISPDDAMAAMAIDCRAPSDEMKALARKIKATPQKDLSSADFSLRNDGKVLEGISLLISMAADAVAQLTDDHPPQESIAKPEKICFSNK